MVVDAAVGLGVIVYLIDRALQRDPETVERRQGERRDGEYKPHEQWFLADAPDRRQSDRREGGRR